MPDPLIDMDGVILDQVAAESLLWVLYARQTRNAAARAWMRNRAEALEQAMEDAGIELPHWIKATRDQTAAEAALYRLRRRAQQRAREDRQA